LLDFAGLAGKADARIATLSGGMKRRLTLARAWSTTRTSSSSTSRPPASTRKPAT
jgi:ABC-type transport system involved in cytochrome c biogenesis ATPase subunit